MTLYLRILSYIKPYMHRLIFAMFCTIMAAAGNLYIPWIIKDMIDEVLADKNGTMLNWIAASIIAIFVVRGLFWYGQNYLMSYVGQSVIIDIRAAVFKKLQRLSVSFYDKNKTGTIMSYVTNDVNALQSAMVENTIEMITEDLSGLASYAFYSLHFPGGLMVYGIFWEKNSQNRRQNPGMYCGYYFGSAGVCGFCQSYQIICQGRLRG